MLIVTYSLVTLSVEQEKTRNILSALQQRAQHCATQSQCGDTSVLESILDQLMQFDEACRERNIELYVIPAIRRATQEADHLLAELEAFSNLGSNILKSVRSHLQQDIEHGMQKVRELAGSMGLYCQHLLKRLSKEDEELFPIARRVITSEEEWFTIASQFISHDAELHANKSSTAIHAPAAGEYVRARRHVGANRKARIPQLEH